MRTVGVLFSFAAIIMIPSFLWGPNAFDSGPYNYVWTKQFADALAQGEIYPRWLPDSFGGLGSPTFFFYPPLAFYVSATFDLIGLSTWQAINAAALVFCGASGMTMHAWLRDKTPHALLLAGLYMAAPYHLADFYARAALAEFAAFAWLPLIALGLERRPRLLAVAFAGLILTHLPTAVLATVGLIGPMVALDLLRRRPVLPHAMAGVIALGLSAVYLLPALTLQEHVAIEQLWTADFKPSRLSIWGRPVWSMVASAAVAVILACAAGLQALRLRAAWTWAAIAVCTALLAAGVIPAVWDLPLLAQVQFPFRMLSIVEFATVTALAIAMPHRELLKLSLALALPVYGMHVGLTAKFMVLDSSAHRGAIAQNMADAVEYLPAGSAPGGLSSLNRDPQLQRFNRGDRFIFPIWRPMRDGQSVQVEGPIIPHGLVIERRILPVERTGAITSLASALLLLLWAVFRRNRRRSSSGESQDELVRLPT